MRITHVKIPSFSQCDVICSTLLLHQLHSVQNYLQPNLLNCNKLRETESLKKKLGKDKTDCEKRKIKELGDRDTTSLCPVPLPQRFYGGTGKAQWWECSTLTNVARVQFSPGARCGLSMLLALVLLRRFSEFSRFPPSTKTNTSNSNATMIEHLHENQLSLLWLPL